MPRRKAAQSGGAALADLANAAKKVNKFLKDNRVVSRSLNTYSGVDWGNDRMNSGRSYAKRGAKVAGQFGYGSVNFDVSGHGKSNMPQSLKKAVARGDIQGSLRGDIKF